MGLTNFPHGVSSFGIPVLGSGGQVPTTTGTYFYVSSITGITVGAGTSPSSPCKTVQQAADKCTASKGDVIIVMPGHTEVLSAAGSITLSKIGVTLVGLGSGANKPTFTYSATAATIVVSAASVTIDNIRLNMGTVIDAVVQGIDLSAADVTIKNVDVSMSSASFQATSCIITDANCGNLKIENCVILAPDAGAAEAISLLGTPNNVQIKNCNINGDFSVAPIHNATGNVLTNLLISDCVLKNDNAGDFALELVSACTGSLVRNFYHSNALATAVDPGSCYSFECFACHQVDKNGLLTPGVDA